MGRAARRGIAHLTAQAEPGGDEAGHGRWMMAKTHSSIATDSAEELRNVIGDDATATFEDDPKFVESDPTGTASSENVEVQRAEDDTEDSDEEETELEDEDLEDEGAEDEDLDDEEEEDEDEEEEDDEVEDDDEDDEEDDDEEAALTSPELMHARGSDEEPADDDAGDVDMGVDEDEAEEDDDLDTDRVVDAALRMSALVTLTAELAQAAQARGGAEAR